MGPVLLIVGWMAVILGWLILVVSAFGTSKPWGLACLFVPVAILAFAVTHWEDSKAGLFLLALGLAVLFFTPGQTVAIPAGTP